MNINPKATLPLNLTGNVEFDRNAVFEYVKNNFTEDETEPEVLVMAATFLPNTIKEILTEIKISPETLTTVCYLISREEKIALVRRHYIISALTKYADNVGKVANEKATKKPLFNFTNEYEEALYQKLSGQSLEGVKVDYPFFKIYYQAGTIAEKLNDWDSAMRFYSKAHNWNPINPKATIKILEALKYEKRAFDLFRLSHWYLQVTYSLTHIASALQYHGYALYLSGKFEEAYACYYSSLFYEETLPPKFNEEVTAILSALGKPAPYELTKSDIKKLFAYTKEKPYPNEMVFDTLRNLIIMHYNAGNFTDVLRYATPYIVIRTHDTKINTIFKVSKLSLD